MCVRACACVGGDGPMSFVSLHVRGTSTVRWRPALFSFPVKGSYHSAAVLDWARLSYVLALGS